MVLFLPLSLGSLSLVLEDALEPGQGLIRFQMGARVVVDVTAVGEAEEALETYPDAFTLIAEGDVLVLEGGFVVPVALVTFGGHGCGSLGFR